jgi:hypothetical protein
MAALSIDASDSLHVKKKIFDSEFKAGHQNLIYYTGIRKMALAGNQGVMITGVKVQFVQDLIYDGIISPDWFGKKISISVASKQILISD